MVLTADGDVRQQRIHRILDYGREGEIAIALVCERWGRAILTEVEPARGNIRKIAVDVVIEVVQGSVDEVEGRGQRGRIAAS